MGREVHVYEPNSIMGEFKEIDLFDKVSPTVIAIGDPKVKSKILTEYPDFKYTILIFGILHDPEIIIGEGTIICPGSRITCGVTIGKHVIINNHCTIPHDCIIGDLTTISPGVNISGNVTIGKLCNIGLGSSIREKISICDNVIIGAGAVVVKNIIDPGTYVGIPAKKIK